MILCDIIKVNKKMDKCNQTIGVLRAICALEDVEMDVSRAYRNLRYFAYLPEVKKAVESLSSCMRELQSISFDSYFDNEENKK